MMNTQISLAESPRLGSNWNKTPPRVSILHHSVVFPPTAFLPIMGKC